MILRLYRAYKTGKTIYSKMLKPFYMELRKDAYENTEKSIKQHKKKNTDAKHKKSKRRNTRQTNS